MSQLTDYVLGAFESVKGLRGACLTRTQSDTWSLNIVPQKDADLAGLNAVCLDVFQQVSDAIVEQDLFDPEKEGLIFAGIIASG